MWAWSTVVAIPIVGFVLWHELRPRPVSMADRYRVEPVTFGDVLRDVRATGHVEAVTTVQVGAEISGRIESVLVDYDAHVTQGQVLARFDGAALAAQLTEAQAAQAAARAALEQARTEREHAATGLARATRLHTRQALPDSELEDAAAASRLAVQRVSAAEAQLASQSALSSIARTNLEHASIRAPIDGVVITRNVDPGQTVASMLQTPILFTVAADLRRMRVLAAVDEADIGEMRVRESAWFTVNAYPDRVFQGVVTEVRSSPVVVQDVVTYTVIVEVDNGDLALKPGMTASARIRTAEARQSLRVPAAALRFTPPGSSPCSGTCVWRLDGTQLVSVPVTAGVSDGELTAVTSGAVAVAQPLLVDLTPAGRKAPGVGP